MAARDAPLLLVATLAAFAAVAALVGRRQRREGGGSLRRLLAVSVGAAALGVAPLIAVAALDHAGLRDSTALRGVASGLALVAFFRVLAWLLPPLRFVRGSEALPALEDPLVLARIGELAGLLGLSCPRARVLNTSGGALTIQAVVGGLPAPSIVVTDGVLHRLAPGERDALLGHELGHLSTGSLWRLAAIDPLAATFAVLAGARITPLAVLVLALLAQLGLRLVIGRLIEVACDLASARVVGHVEMAGAVHKIHAAHPLPRAGWLQVLVHATSTHPALATRRRALWWDAPRDAQPRIAVDWVAAGRAGRTARIAFVLWLAAVVAVLVLGAPHASPGAAFCVGAVGIFAPRALFWLALRRQRRLGERRVDGDRVPWRWLLAPATGLLFIGGSVVTWRPESPEWGIACVVAASALALAGTLPGDRRRRARQEVTIALHKHDWPGAIAVARARPGVMAADRSLRTNVALARVLAGDRAGGLAELEALGAEPRPFPAALLWVSAVSETLEPARAVRAAERAVALLPGDAGALAVLAAALRRAGRVVDAAGAIEQALALEPDVGVFLAIQAGTILDHGDVSGASARVERALELSPGDPCTLIARAEVALAVGDASAAAVAVAAASAAARATPLSFLDDAARALERRLEALRSRPES